MYIELTCIKCGWAGSDTELVSLTDDPDDNDFSYCPNYEHNEFDEEEVD